MSFQSDKNQSNPNRYRVDTLAELPTWEPPEHEDRVRALAHVQGIQLVTRAASQVLSASPLAIFATGAVMHSDKIAWFGGLFAFYSLVLWLTGPRR